MTKKRLLSAESRKHIEDFRQVLRNHNWAKYPVLRLQDLVNQLDPQLTPDTAAQIERLETQERSERASRVRRWLTI